MAKNTASAKWTGNLKEGEGHMALGGGTFDGAFTFRSRFEDGEGTNPEELISAALAGCFSMALGNILAEAGHTAESISTSARAQLRPVDGVPTITQMHIETEGVVPGIDQDEFQRYADDAKKNCVISRALAGVQDFELEATLAS